MAKKTRKVKQKRQMKTKERKRQKRKQKQSDLRAGSTVNAISGSPATGATAPEGFRPAGAAQAMMEYLRPLIDRYGEAGDVSDLNSVFSLGMLVYNYAVALEKGRAPESSEQEILQSLRNLLGVQLEEARDLMQRMVERKRHLLPEDVQTGPPNTMFIRKTGPVEIPERYPEELLPRPRDPESSESLRELLSCLDRLEAGTDDPDFEQDLRKAQDVAAECFKQWLRDSGGTVNPETLTQFVRMYLEYLYGYSPDRDVGLSRSVPRDTVREFLLSHLTRKLYLEDPSEYAYAPPALILFHQFLQRSGWLSGQLALEATQSLLETQPEFTEMLRRHYS